MAFAVKVSARLPLGSLTRGFSYDAAGFTSCCGPASCHPLNGMCCSASTPDSHPMPGAALPRTLASPRTGLAPAGCPELVTRLRHDTSSMTWRPSCWTHTSPEKEDLFAELLDRTVACVERDGVADASPGPARDSALRAGASRRHEPVWQPSQSCGTAAAARGARCSLREVLGERARLRGRYRSLIRDADRAGRVVDRPLEMSTDLVFGAVEATMTWSARSRGASIARTADAVASAAGRGVLVRPPSQERLRGAANRLRNED